MFVRGQWEVLVMSEEQRSRDFWNHTLSVEFRQAHHVAYSVGRVRNLPDLLKLGQNFEVHIAIIESWLVHARALCEFFLIHTSNQGVQRDFTAADYGWDKSHLDDYFNLDCWWVIASRHLMHFSKARTPDDLFQLVEADLDVETLKGEGERFFMLALDFLDHLQEIDHEDHEAWVIALDKFVG